VTKTVVIFCVVPRVYYQSANPAPQGEKLPIDQDDHCTGEFGVRPHHGGRCIDRHSYQVGVIRILLQTSPLPMNMYASSFITDPDMFNLKH
jgi:hypothetical protein